MDSIQALTSKTNPAATTLPAANDDSSAGGLFSALLDLVGSKFKTDSASLGMDTKLMRGNDAGDDVRDAARDASAKLREDKNDERAPAKSKESKSRDDDNETDASKAAANEDQADSDAADAATTTDGQTAATVVAVVPVELPLVTTEILAPVLIAQQVVDPAAARQTVTQAAAVTAETAAVASEAVETTTVAAATVADKAAVVEAPAAVQKAVETTAQGFKQVVAQTAGPAETVAQDNAKTTVSADTGAATKTKEDATANVVTQRSAVAQAQSQDLSRQVGPETKAQVQVTVTSHAGPQAAMTPGVYDIYSGYSNAQTSTANGQAGAADATNALVQNTKTPVEAVQAQVIAPSPALAPQPHSQAPQQGPSSSAVRADIAAPAPAQTSGNHSSFGESSFGSAGSSSQSNATTSTSQTAQAERPLGTAQQVIDQIKVNITRAAKAGLDKVTIQLKPHELGRVDVQLEMSEDHKVRVTVTADNKDTLALLQNDSRTLENALKDAGLRTDSNNLHFSLRSESDAQQAQDGRNGGKNAGATDGGATDEADDIAMTYDYAEIARARGGIDTFA